MGVVGVMEVVVCEVVVEGPVPLSVRVEGREGRGVGVVVVVRAREVPPSRHAPAQHARRVAVQPVVVRTPEGSLHTF